MSFYYFLVCHDDRSYVHVGQGNSQFAAEALYSGNEQTMRSLRHFLNDHRGKSLEFLCADANDHVYEYTEYDAGPEVGGVRISESGGTYMTSAGIKTAAQIRQAMEGKTVAEIEAAGGDPFADQNPDAGKLL